MKSALLFLLSLIVFSPISAEAENVKKATACPVLPLEVEQLPNLNTPRSGHRMLILNDEIVVFGGHTSGFVPTPTAEYFARGQWHQLDMVYRHDNGMVCATSSGKVIVAGGHEQPLGIGQTFTVELYSPTLHQFEGYGCLDRKRCFAEAVEIDSGKVIIAGNWYNDDGIECYKGNNIFSDLKKVTAQRAAPFLFKTADNDVLIFSAMDIHGNTHDKIVVDRLHGKSFSPTLFQSWKPLGLLIHNTSDESFIGDATKSDFRYLLPIINQQNQVAIAFVEGEKFSLLPTTADVPTTIEGHAISFMSSVIADRNAGIGYLVGKSDDQRYCVVSINYAHAGEGKKAPVALYCTEQLDSILPYSVPVLTPSGNLVLAGGDPGNNFAPCKTVYLLKMNKGQDAILSSSQLSRWPFIIITGLLLLAASYVYLIRKRKRDSQQPAPISVSDETADEQDAAEASAMLMDKICCLMDTERIFLNNDLKVQDVANRLHIHKNSVSECINAQKGCTFSQFVNSYRIDYAQQLLRNHPDMKLSMVGSESGFATETSFFRTFKAFTGMTPRESLQLSSGH